MNSESLLMHHDKVAIYTTSDHPSMYAIRLVSLAVVDGSDDDFAKHTYNALDTKPVAMQSPGLVTPMGFRLGLDTLDPQRVEDKAEDNADFHDALEMWADWCDRQDEAADLADGMPAGM